MRLDFVAELSLETSLFLHQSYSRPPLVFSCPVDPVPSDTTSLPRLPRRVPEAVRPRKRVDCPPGVNK